MEKHFGSNTSVRDMRVGRGIQLQNLPQNEDIKKKEHRIKSQEKIAKKTAEFLFLSSTTESGFAQRKKTSHIITEKI